MKTKHVNLAKLNDEHFDGEFLVVSAQDQIEYLPGMRLRKSDVDALCRNGAWKVRIIAVAASGEKGGGK